MKSVEDDGGSVGRGSGGRCGWAEWRDAPPPHCRCDRTDVWDGIVTANLPMPTFCKACLHDAAMRCAIYVVSVLDRLRACAIRRCVYG